MLDMQAPTSTLPGIGLKTAEILKSIGLFTVRDLLYYLPRTYDNYQIVSSLANIRPGRVTVRGHVEKVNSHPARQRHLTIIEAIITDGTDSIRAVWFNQAYRASQFNTNRDFIFSGRYELHNGRYVLSSPVVRLAPEKPADNADTASATDNAAAFQPVYPAKRTLTPENFKRLISNLRPCFADIPDLLPMSATKPDFVFPKSRSEALYKAHFAKNNADTETARTYLAYEELFELILAARLNQIENQKLKTIAVPYNNDLMHRFLKTLPFTLTDAQKAATWQILQDLEKTTPMNRLLQGDVGAGKTVVAAAAALQVIKQDHQVALLAPTSVLAAQHAESLNQLLKPFDVNVTLLIGATKGKPALKKRIISGDAHLIVGTHAILTDDTVFHDLALCIIDEQHRFGVNQRQKLLEKGIPHLLTMTATPIPRSLQLTIFGDLDISTIRQLPKGRQPIITEVMPSTNMRDRLYPRVREELAQGRQVYWICRLIEDNPRQETTSVKRQADKLTELFPQARVAFLHGRMKPDEKDAIMTRFSNHEIDILVSTTVVEVGVNVPNATIMVIMDAEGYGLAQLHQLRGRVGRGEHQSYCYLVTENDQPTRRLREMEKSTDGFHLAEVDLKIRGPGEIYGSLQHGALDLRIATLSDTHLISLAQKQVGEFIKDPEALACLNSSSNLAKPSAAMLKYKELSDSIRKYQQLTTLN